MDDVLYSCKRFAEAISFRLSPVAGFALVALSATAGAQQFDLGGDTHLVSFASDGSVPPQVRARTPVMTSDARFVVFSLETGSLSPLDTSWRPDVYLRDRIAGTTELISSGTDNQYDAITPTVSEDGQFVAYSAHFSNYWYHSYIYLKNRATGQLSRLTRGFTPCLSADGRYLTYTDVDYDIAPSYQIYRYTIATGQVDCLSRSSVGVVANSSSLYGSMSHDGRYLSFLSRATNFDPRATNGQFNTFVKDTVTGAVQLASITTSGDVPNQDVTRAMISANGRHVTFTTSANNVVPNDTNGTSDVFVRDLDDDQTICASVSSDGFIGNAKSMNGSLSWTGRYIVFDSLASNLDDFTKGKADVYMRDLRTGTTRCATVKSNGDPGTGSVNTSDRVQIPGSVSRDGTQVLFGGEGDMDGRYPAGGYSQHLFIREFGPIVPFTLTFNRHGLQYGAPDTKIQGKLTLDKRTSVDTTFSLSSSSSKLEVPSEVTVPAGSKTVRFLATAHQPEEVDYVRVVATSGEGLSTGCLFTLRFIRLMDLEFSSDTIVAGSTIAATVTLGSAAEIDTLVTINLFCSQPGSRFSVPTEVTVPAGQSSVTFPISVTDDVAAEDVNIQAVVGRQIVNQGLSVTTCDLSTLTINPTSFVGGSDTSVTMTITLTGPAGDDGALIHLGSQNAGLGFDDNTVHIPTGQSSITVPIRHQTTSASYTGKVGARNKGVHKTATMTVLPSG